MAFLRVNNILEWRLAFMSNILNGSRTRFNLLLHKANDWIPTYVLNTLIEFIRLYVFVWWYCVLKYFIYLELNVEHRLQTYRVYFYCIFFVYSPLPRSSFAFSAFRPLSSQSITLSLFALSSPLAHFPPSGISYSTFYVAFFLTADDQFNWT